MNKRLRRISLLKAWCPKVRRVHVSLYPWKTVVHRSVLVAGVVLTVLWGLIISSYVIMTDYYETHYGLFPIYERVEIAYVAANKTSREIFCKLRNTGNAQSIIEEVRVNGTKVSTGDPLPITMDPILGYKTYVFRYDGPWEGSILISFRNPHSGYVFEQLVDLEAASRNTIEGAYPSKDELQRAFFESHLGEIACTIYDVSIKIFLIGIAIVIPLLVLRSRMKVEPHLTPWGGMMIALSFILSVLVSALGIVSPELPQIILIALPILVYCVAAPITIVGTAFVLLALKALAELYRERRIFRNAIYGFVCMVMCVVAAAMLTAEAYSWTLGRDRLVMPLAPIAPPLRMPVRGYVSPEFMTAYVFVSVITFVSLLLATVFFRRSLILLSTKSNKRRLEKVWSLLTLGSVLIVFFSGAILTLIPWESIQTVGATFEYVWVLDLSFATAILICVGILSAAWMITSRTFSSIRASEATRSPPISISNIGQE